MNFFAVRDAIAEALREALPDVAVLTADDLEGVEEAAQPTPAVHLIYQSFDVVSTVPSGKTAQIRQGWMAVCVERHDGEKRKASREVGGRIEPLVNGVLNTLMGWRHPDTGMRPLVITSPPEPKWRRPFYYFPLTFSADAALEKSK